MFKKLKKIISNALAVLGVAACVTTFGACETNSPKVEMQIKFNGETYTLEYNLSRKITPSTVKHFLSLVENKYYDGMCVHDYDYSDDAGQAAGKLYTGAYVYKNNTLALKNGKTYFETVASYIPQTVFTDREQNNPTYTLYGEFENNEFQVESGALKERFGSLVMYYHDREHQDDVYVSRNSDSVASLRNYEENSATSEFYITLSPVVSSNKDYCVFATLDEDSVDMLSDFKADLAAYIEDNHDGDKEKFVKEEEMHIDDPFGDIVEEFDVPVEPIVIEYIKITKY